MRSRKDFMRLAIEEARIGISENEQPFGAVVALGNEVIARTHSLKVTKCDPTAHAETLAIRAASQKLGRRILSDCVFYTTCEPCPMCLGALLNAEVNRLVIGARIQDLSSIGVFDFHNYSAENFAAMVGWNLSVESDVLREECIGLYRQAAVGLTR